MPTTSVDHDEGTTESNKSFEFSIALRWTSEANVKIMNQVSVF